MGEFYLIKANFLYLSFNAFIEEEIPVQLSDKNRHIQVLVSLEEKIADFLKEFDFSDFYEMPFIDSEGIDNGYFLRKIGVHKNTGLKAKLELMVKRVD